MAAACDIRIAAPDAKIAIAETQWGQERAILCPESGNEIIWKCGGNRRRPEWQGDPDYTECVSNWINELRPSIERWVSSQLDTFT